MFQQQVVAESFVHFDSASWWVSEIFDHKGQQYAHLMREAVPGQQTFRANYARVTADGFGLFKVSHFEWQEVAQAWFARKTADILNRGVGAVPRVGRYSDVENNDDPDNPYGYDDGYGFEPQPGYLFLEA